MKEVYEGIVSFLKNYQERTHVKGYVLGISGGKDSTVVAKLLVDSIGKENILGVLMPNGKQADIEDSYNKFNEILNATGTAVLKKRAEIINADAREAAKDQVNLIEKEIRQIKSKIMNLEDLSIKSTESLVVGTDFKADEWVTQMFKLRDDLRNAEICLEIAQNIYNEYFTELPEVDCDKKAE